MVKRDTETTTRQIKNLRIVPNLSRIGKRDVEESKEAEVLNSNIE